MAGLREVDPVLAIPLLREIDLVPNAWTSDSDHRRARGSRILGVRPIAKCWLTSIQPPEIDGAGSSIRL